MKNNKMHFIRTSDKDTCEALRQEGFMEISQQGDYHIFINDFSKADFSSGKVNESKISYTNTYFA